MKNKWRVVFVLCAIFLIFFCVNNKTKINITKTKDKAIIGTENKKENNNVEKQKNTSNNNIVTNSNIIGKITINNTSINENIVQGNDNDYYLNHSITGEKSSIGSTFLDYRNKKYDRKIIIYGHNSKTVKNLPFHDLEKYLDKSFYESNKYINLNLFQESSKWEIFSVMIVEGNYHMKLSFNDEEWIKHINWMKNNSVFNTDINIDQHDKVLTLQTCYYKPENSYLLINAKKIGG